MAGLWAARGGVENILPGNSGRAATASMPMACQRSGSYLSIKRRPRVTSVKYKRIGGVV